MRKRKSPIVLVTALVVIVTCVAGLQFAWSRTGGVGVGSETPEVTDTKPVGDVRPGETPKTVNQDIKGLLGKGEKSAARMVPPKGMPGEPGSGPLIVNPNHASTKPAKPTPNTSSTAAQWYNDESAMSKDKG